MVRTEGGSLRFWGPGLLSTSPAFSMSSASHSAGSSGWLAPKTGAGPTFQWAGKVDAICRSRSNRAKRPRAGCIFRSLLGRRHHHHHAYGSGVPTGDGNGVPTGDGNVAFSASDRRMSPRAHTFPTRLPDAQRWSAVRSSRRAEVLFGITGLR